MYVHVSVMSSTTATYYYNNNNNNSKKNNSYTQRHEQLQQMTTISTAVAATVTNTSTITTATINTTTTTTTTPPHASVKKFVSATAKHRITKSSSLDHEIFPQQKHQHHHQHQHYIQQQQQQHQQLHSRKITAAEWKRYNTIHGGSMTRTGSTSSLASVATTTGTTTTAAAAVASANYQELKMEIINQGKCLCGQYIRSRLRRAGVLNRKAIQRLRTILESSSPATSTSDGIVYEVFPALNSMGEELERMHPRIYSNVSRQLSRAPFGELQDGDTAPMLLNLVAKDLFRHSITWGKIISIFAVCGGFAIDCVRQGHYDYLQYLIDGLTEIIEDDLVYWLVENGGWRGLQQHIRRPHDTHISFLGMLAMFVALSSGVYVITNFVKHLGGHLYSLLF